MLRGQSVPRPSSPSPRDKSCATVSLASTPMLLGSIGGFFSIKGESRPSDARAGTGKCWGGWCTHRHSMHLGFIWGLHRHALPMTLRRRRGGRSAVRVNQLADLERHRGSRSPLLPLRLLARWEFQGPFHPLHISAWPTRPFGVLVDLMTAQPLPPAPLRYVSESPFDDYSPLR